jgi:hypothetical protein
MRGHESLAERFLLHYHITNLDEVKTYQDRATTLGLKPFTHEEVEHFQRRYDRLVGRFGPEYKQRYGWALGVIKVSDGFKGLEAAAGIDRLRSHYKWASSEIHAGSKGLVLNRVVRGLGHYLSTGATNAGLSTPGQLALTSLVQCSTALVLGGAELASPRDLYGVQAAGLLTEDAFSLFAAGERSVRQAEEKYMRRRYAKDAGFEMRKKRMRLDGFRQDPPPASTFRR